MKTIYCLDDQPLMLEQYKVMLDDYNVVVFDDIKAFFVSLEYVKPDLIICDLMMPWMTGWEAIDQIRKTRPKVPIIVATALDEIEQQITAEIQGCSYWNKTNETSVLRGLACKVTT